MDLYLFEDLLTARNEADLKASAQRITQQLGYDNFQYGLAYRQAGDDELRYYLLGSYPEQWLDRYFDQRYIDIDPSMLHCVGNSTPLIWTHRLHDAPKVIDMHHDAISLGINGGGCIPVHTPWLNGAGMLCLSSREDADKAAPRAAETVGLWMLFACYLNQAVRNLALPDDMGFRQKEELTPRELECLRWAAKGLAAKLIADRMGVSAATVNAHYLPAIRRKLQVRTTREAVSVAVYHRLIAP